MQKQILNINGFEITIVELLFALFIIILASIFYYKLKDIFKKLNTTHLSIQKESDFKKRLLIVLFMLCVLIIHRILNFDIRLFYIGSFDVSFSQVIEFFTLISFAVLFDWIIRHIIIENRYNSREVPLRRHYDEDKKDSKKGTYLVRYIIILYLARIVIHRFDIDIIFFQKTIKGELFTVQLSDLLVAVLTLLVARFLVWFIIQVSLYRMYRNNKMDSGTQFAINQIVKYVIYVIAFIVALDRLVSDMSLIYGGAAALLVGIGLGLQQIFNDFFSGIILLFERTVMVGDIVEIDGHISRVTKIGLRASRVETRDNTSQVVPNSKLVNSTVLNMTHNDNNVRFEIKIVLPYNTDTERVNEILLECAYKNSDVLKNPEPYVWLLDFDERGLQMALYFYSSEIMTAENIKSQLRFSINQALIQHGIKVPFPQRDIHLFNKDVQ